MRTKSKSVKKDQNGIRPTAKSKAAQVNKVINLLDSWLADDTDYDEKTWPALKEALERDRLGTRRMFNE